MTVWMGLTGGVGNSKSLAVAESVRLDVPHIDADAISQNLTADNDKALPTIRGTLGGEVFDTRGRLDREVLRDFVFRRSQPKEILGGLMFPLILKEVRFRQNRYPQAVYGIIDVPLLIENPQFLVLVGEVLVTDVAGEVQTRRIRQHSGLDENKIRHIIRTQISRRDRLLHADNVLVNEDSASRLAAKVNRLHRLYPHTVKTVWWRKRKPLFCHLSGCLAR